MLRRTRVLVLFLAVGLLVVPRVWGQDAKTLRIGIMQSKRGEAQKYAPLIAYMKTKGIDVKLIGTRSYPDAAEKFSAGKLDAMFSGSGVAGCMIIKGVARPLVRPVNKAGWSTYWAVVVAKKGAPKFGGEADYFKDKAVLCCSLASSGEFFLRASCGKTAKPKMHKASSHGAALLALAKGKADVVVVKNRVWDSMSSDFKTKGALAELEVVGKDTGENPDGTLMISNKVSDELATKVKEALLKAKTDGSAAAAKLCKSLGIAGYTATSAEDFSHTLKLLKAAGVDKDFDFTFAD